MYSIKGIKRVGGTNEISGRKSSARNQSDRSQMFLQNSERVLFTYTRLTRKRFHRSTTPLRAKMKPAMPMEIVDEILLHLPVTFAIQLNREYPKRKLLEGWTAKSARDLPHAQWLHKYDVKGAWPEDVYYRSASNGRVIAMKWLEEHYTDHITEDVQKAALYQALRSGRSRAFAYLCEQGFESDDCIILSAQLGDVVKLKAMLENVTDLAQSLRTAYYYAAASAQSDMIIKLHQAYPGIQIEEDVMEKAVERGYMDIIKYLYENTPISFTHSMIAQALIGGDFEVFQYMFERASEWYVDLPIDALLAGHSEIFQYLCGLDAFEDYKITPAIIAGLSRAGRLDMIEVLHSIGTGRFDKSVMDAAIEVGQIEIVKWLHKHRTEGCSDHALVLAVDSGSVELVKYIYRHFPNASSTAKVREAMRKATYNLDEEEVYPHILDIFEFFHSVRKKHM